LQAGPGRLPYSTRPAAPILVPVLHRFHIRQQKLHRLCALFRLKGRRSLLSCPPGILGPESEQGAPPKTSVASGPSSPISLQTLGENVPYRCTLGAFSTALCWVLKLRSCICIETTRCCGSSLTTAIDSVNLPSAALRSACSFVPVLLPADGLKVVPSTSDRLG
jgi:hypothetical protein